jgi:hypothetical protein
MVYVNTNPARNFMDTSKLISVTRCCLLFDYIKIQIALLNKLEPSKL